MGTLEVNDTETDIQVRMLDWQTDSDCVCFAEYMYLTGLSPDADNVVACKQFAD